MKKIHPKLKLETETLRRIEIREQLGAADTSAASCYPGIRCPMPASGLCG